MWLRKSTVLTWAIIGLVSLGCPSRPMVVCSEADRAKADELIIRANELHGVGAYGEEFELASRAVGACPAHFRAYVTRGRSRHKLGDLKQACFDFKRALELAQGGDPSPIPSELQFIANMRKQCESIGYWDDLR